MERSWKQGSARSTEVACSVLDRGECIGGGNALTLCENTSLVELGNNPDFVGEGRAGSVF